MTVPEKSLLRVTSRCFPQPEKILVPLKMHQKTALNRMITLEKGPVEVYYLQERQKLRSNVAILADLVGAGKSLTILSLIASHPAEQISDIWNPRCAGVYLEPSYHINSSVIIVPDNIFHQWIEYITEQTSLSLMIFRDQISLFDVIYGDNVDVILVSKRVAKEFLSLNIMVDRLIIDEIDLFMPVKNVCKKGNINSQDINLMAKFFWMVTATPGCLFGNKPSTRMLQSAVHFDHYKKNKVHDYLEFPTNLFVNLPTYLIVNNLIVKNDDEFVKASTALPDPQFQIIQCLQPKSFQVCVNFMPQLEKELNGHNLVKVALILGCKIETPEEILGKIENEIEWKLITIQTNLVTQQKLLEETVNLTEFRINSIESQIREYKDQEVATKTRLDAIRKNIAELKSGCCNICYFEFENDRDDNPATFLHCCKNLICTLCISEVKSKQDSCPYCRARPLNFSISTDYMERRNREGEEGSRDGLENVGPKEKITTLLKILRDNKHGRFLIFASEDGSFNDITRNLENNGYPYHILKKDSGNVKEQIGEFSSGVVNILLMNATVHGAGLNLQCASHIIMFHRLDQLTREQVIGRGQRMGRPQIQTETGEIKIQPLKVIELRYPHE